jgi:predicted nuclease with TOPRIM domain
MGMTDISELNQQLADVLNKATEWKLEAARARRAMEKANERYDRVHKEASEHMEEIFSLRKEKAILTARVSELQELVQKVVEWKL